jgi:spermidine dehydrogenase
VDDGETTRQEFLARTPLSEAACKEIARLYETQVDPLPHLSRSEKRDYLRGITYRDFLADVVGIGPEALRFLNDAGYWAIGIDGLSAWGAATDGEAGTEGLGFGGDDGERAYFQFPDGNASIARLLVRSLIPGVAPGSGMEDIVTARFDYGQLDRAGSPVRIRLDSMAVRVRHRGAPGTAEEVEVTYVRSGRAQRVRAGRVVLACYHSVIPYLCEELPDLQKQALSRSLKAPLVYTNVLLRNWKAFEKLGVEDVRCPGSYFEDVYMNRPISIGDYRYATSPEDPTVVRLFRVPLAPGLSPQEQWKAGRHELLSTPFETFERKIRDQLQRILSPGGFDAARDIAAITVNRWPHGYAYGQDLETGEVAFVLDEVPPERSSWLVGRKRFGRIAIANSDAAAMAMTEGAIGEAHRAVMELIST